jgi:uncharacterized protein
MDLASSKMADWRYLIRLKNRRSWSPGDAKTLMAQLRESLSGAPVSLMNMRVNPIALEFDLFLPNGQTPDAYLQALKSFGETLTIRRLEETASAAPAAELVNEAQALFNDQRFWEVHEVLEGLWKRSAGDEKRLIQGLILLAAAFVHVQKAELGVVPAMLSDSLTRLAGPRPAYHGWNLEATRHAVRERLARRDWTPFSV